MVPLFNRVYSLAISIVSGIGILPNAFIVAVNLLDWAKGRSLNTCDWILVALAVSYASFQLSLIGKMYVSIEWSGIHHLDYVYPVAFHLVIWSSSSTSWLVTCLCVFYCVKIMDCNHFCFIWIKLRISKVVPWLMLGSVVGSLVLTLPMYWNDNKDFHKNATAMNMTTSYVPGDKMKLWSTMVDVLGLALPILLGIASITLVLISLYRHTQRMRENASDFSQPRLDAHFGAAKVLGSLFLLYIFSGSISLLPPHHETDAAVWLTIVSSSIVQTIILILGNTKLRKALWKVLPYPLEKMRCSPSEEDFKAICLCTSSCLE